MLGYVHRSGLWKTSSRLCAGDVAGPAWTSAATWLHLRRELPPATSARVTACLRELSGWRQQLRRGATWPVLRTWPLSEHKHRTWRPKAQFAGNSGLLAWIWTESRPASMGRRGESRFGTPLPPATWTFEHRGRLQRPSKSGKHGNIEMSKIKKKIGLTTGPRSKKKRPAASHLAYIG